MSQFLENFGQKGGQTDPISLETSGHVWGLSTRKYLHKMLNRRITLSVSKYYKLDKKVTILMTNFVKDRRATNYRFKIIVRAFMP